MATEDIVGRDLGGDISQIVQSLKIAMDTMVIGKKVKYTGSDPAKIEKTELLNQKREINKENKALIESLTSDLEKVLGNGFKEGQAESAKYVKEMAEKINDLTATIMSGDLKTLKKKQEVLKKEEKKLASFQLMKAFKNEQGNQLEKQTNILQQILTHFTNGVPTGIPVNTTTPASRSSSLNIAGDMSDGAETFIDTLSRWAGGEGKDKFSDLFGGAYSKTPNQIIFGNQNPFKGIMAELQSVSKNLLAIGEHQSLLQVLTEGTVESQLKYEQSMREALYLTAGATRESTELFKSMSKIGNTVELTGFKQEETQKAMVKFAKMGVKYDGDAEKYKKKLLGLSTATLNTEKQLGLEAGSLQETFGDLYRFGVLNENSIANLGRGMREVSRTTGISGEAFKKVLGTTQGIVDAMRRASTLTAASARNITELGANAEKFGVSDEFNNINKALASTTNLFNDASDGTRLLLFSAAASVGKLQELQAGTLTRSKEGIKSLTQGVNNVFKRFGIESADAIDQLSDSAKMKLNLVLKSSFDLELGQVKGVLKTLEASGKTFADKLLDLDKQLGKNISTEKRSAILEEQRKIKIDKNLDLLGILSEAAETSKTMTDAFGKFGTRRKEFESDLQALGLGGSNKDVIREAVSQSLTGVNAALSKAGLDKISISTAEMAKALEDPQSYQDLLSTLKNGEMKAAANSKGTLTGIDAVRFGIDKLNATVQDAVSGPLSSFLNQGVTGILAANAAILFMPAIMGKLMSSTLMQKFLARPSASSGGPTPTPTPSPTPTPTPPAGGGGAGSMFKGAGTGAMKFAAGWAKFAASTLAMAVLLGVGFKLLKQMDPIPEDEIQDLLSKVKYLGIGIGAATVMMGEVYLATMAMQGMTKMMRKINPKSFLALALGIPILAAAAYFVPPFIVALANFANSSFEGVDLEKVGKTAQDVGSLMASGALLIGSLVASVAIIGGTGYVAMALLNPATFLTTLLALPAGAMIIAAAAYALPPFIKSIADLSDASINSNNLNPAQIQKSLNSLIAIMEPFSKLLGFVALIGASLAGIAVGGLVGGAIGASAYLLGEAVSMISGGMIKNYGDVNVVISETLRHYFSLINSTNSAIVAYMGALTPAQVIASLNKLQSFNEANKLSGIVLKDFAVSFGSAIPAYAAIANLSGKLSGIAVNTPEEIANKFKGIINIMQGINMVGVELEKNQAANSTSQTSALKDMMYNLANNAIPLFSALEKIQEVTASKAYQTVSSSQATFAKASKVLQNITPHLSELLINIKDISTKVYEELKDLNLQNIKEGSDAATSVVGLFNQFIDSAKISGKDLSIKKIREFSDNFGNPEMVNSLRTVMKSTISIAKIFNEEGTSSLDLASISSRTKYYSEFYSAVGDIMSSYGKMSTTFKKPESSASGMTQGNFWLGLTQLYGSVTGQGFYANESAKKEFEAQMKAQEAISPLNPAKIEESMRQSFAVITAMIKVTQDKNILPSVNDMAATRVALLGLMSGMKVIAEFSNLFDIGIIKSTTELFKNLELIPEVGGAKLFGKIGMSMTGMISALQNMVTNSKQFVEAGSKDFVKMSEVFSDLKEPLEKLNDVFGELSKLTSIQKTPDFWKNFIDSFPNTDSAELSKRMGFLKSYIVEMNKLVEPSFMSAIMSLGKIQGLSIDSKTSSAIELLSNLNNFMNALKTQVGSATVPTSGDKKLVQFDISGMTKFLTENAIPVLNSVKEVAEKLNNLPLNKTQLEQASAKMNLLGQLGNGLTDFSVNFYKSADFFTKQVRKTREVDGKTEVYGRYEDTSKQREEFFANNINQLYKNAETDKLAVEKAETDKQNIIKIYGSLGGKKRADVDAALKKAQEKLVASNQAIYDATRPGALPAGIPEKTTWVESFETQGDKIKDMFENPKLKEGFSIVGKMPKFFKENILDPFVAGGGAKLKASNIQFISGALNGIKDIIKVISGEDGLMTVIEVQLRTLASSSTSGGGGDSLKKATDVLNDLGKGDAFSSFLNSLLVNIILPMRFAAKISGGSKNLTEATQSFTQMQTLIASLPAFFKLINTELPKMSMKDNKGASNLNIAISNINSIKDTLPKFLGALSYGVILPVLKNLPPVAFITQASKRLNLAAKLAESMEPFIGKFAELNAKIGGNFESFNLITCLTGLITKLNPADEALSMLAEKLITVKESLQSIADSMNDIMSINSKSDVISMLTGISEFSNTMAEKISNAVSTNGLQGITSRMEINSVSNKEEPTDKDIENIAEKSEENVNQNNTIIAALNKMIDIWTSTSKTSGNNGINNARSNNGAIVLNSGTGSGQTTDGSIFNSSAYGNNIKLPLNT